MQCLFGSDGPSRQSDFACHMKSCSTNQAREASTVRIQSDFRFGKAKPCARTGNHHITVERERDQ